MATDLFGDAGSQPPAKPLTVFRAELLSHGQATWEELFDGYTALKAITFSSSLEFLLRLADRLDDMEIVFGSESILSKEHLALAQASQTIQAYGFADALVDQKALVEALARLSGRAGRASGRAGRRRQPAFSAAARAAQPREALSAVRSGRQSRRHRLGQSQPGRVRGPAARGLRGIRRRSPPGRCSTAITSATGRTACRSSPMRWSRAARRRAVARDTPLALEEVPIVRVLNAGVALVDQPPRPAPSGFAADALRKAAALGAELKELALPKDKAGRTVVNAASVLRVIRSHQARPRRRCRRGPHPARRDRLRDRAWCASTACPGCGPTSGAGGGRRPRRAHPGRLSRQLPRLLRQRRRARSRSTGRFWSGSMRRPPRRICARPPCRSASIPGSIRSTRCCTAVRAAARRCSPELPRARCSASRR